MATRGKPVVELTNQSTVPFAPMRSNSEKPREFFDLVEKLCPAPAMRSYSRGNNVRDGTGTATNIQLTPVSTRRRQTMPTHEHHERKRPPLGKKRQAPNCSSRPDQKVVDIARRNIAVTR
jgi:hypothetical protein